jgi:DNA-binding transcriptional MerR regulator
LRFIGRARDLGFPIEEIRTLLGLWHDRHRSSADVKQLALSRAAELKRKAKELDEMRRSLEHLAARCHGDDRPDCPILGGLEGAGK